MPSASPFRLRAHTREHLPKVPRLILRTQEAAAEAREYNRTISPEQAEDLYLAGMNSIAEKFWRLARAAKSKPEEIRLYAELLLKHFEQKLKKEKINVMTRHLVLLETKAKALSDAVRDPNLSNTELAERVREIFHPQPNGSFNGRHPKEVNTRLLQNGVAP